MLYFIKKLYNRFIKK